MNSVKCYTCDDVHNEDKEKKLNVFACSPFNKKETFLIYFRMISTQWFTFIQS